MNISVQPSKSKCKPTLEYTPPLPPPPPISVYFVVSSSWFASHRMLWYTYTGTVDCMLSALHTQKWLTDVYFKFLYEFVVNYPSPPAALLNECTCSAQGSRRLLQMLQHYSSLAAPHLYIKSGTIVMFY